MSFLPALGAMVRGYTDQAAATQLQQQRQMALAQALRDQQARQLLFSGISGLPQGGGGGQVMPQPPMTGTPPMPGAPSVPAQNPAGAPPQAPPPATPSGPATPAMGPAPATAAPAGPPMGMGGGQAGPDQSGMDPFQAVMRIAADLKARNPNADPQVLASAVSQMIDLMKGIQPDIRAQMQYAAQLMAIQGRRDIAAARDQTQLDIAGQKSQDFEARTAAMVQMNAARIAGADQRVAFVQKSISDRFNAGLQNKNVTAGQRNQLVAAKNRYDSAKNVWNQLQANIRAGTAVDPKQLQTASDNLNAAIENLNTVGTRIAGDIPGAPPAGPTGPGAPGSPATPPDQGTPAPGQPDLNAEPITKFQKDNAPPADTPPPGAPDPKGKPDGSTFSGLPGWEVRGGKWVRKKPKTLPKAA